MFPNVVPADSVRSRVPWGAWGRVPGYLLEVASGQDRSRARHFFGGEPGAFPTCSCCGGTMRIYATIDLADADVVSVLGSRPPWLKLLLPYCPGCSGLIGINVFRLLDRGKRIETVYQNRGQSPNRFKPSLPEFCGVPMRLTKMTDDMFPTTEVLYRKNIERWCGTRPQLGGAPLFCGTYDGVLSPKTGKMMRFVASIAEIDDLTREIGSNARTGLGITGCVYFFIDWVNGYLGSVYQQ